MSIKKRIYLFSFLFLVPVIFPQQGLRAQNEDQYFEISKSIQIITNIFKELNRSYVDPIYPGKMTKAGVDAMLAGLDPYTNYFTEADAENFKMQSEGQYGGIGIVTVNKDSQIVVRSVYQNSPANKAGINPGDILISVNDQSLIGRSTDELQTLMRGDKGSALTLVTKNPVSGKETTKSIVRDNIDISNVPFSGLVGDHKDIAYVRLTQFMGPASFNIKRALDSLKKIQPQLKGVVLDLRGNPGGLLNEAVRTCNLFIPEDQTVVVTKGKEDDWQKTFKTTALPWDTSIPLAVLVNHQSASASEIVAGTIQDLDRGVIIGTQSFGKGLVQQVRPIGFNTSLKLTVAHYFTPSGRCIQALDYSHRNEDGSVSKVPESERHSFKTKNGRTVKDGGGISPDIFIDEEESDDLMKTLQNKDYIFNYATNYFYKHPQIAPAESFHLSAVDFTDFRNWLNREDFSGQTKQGDLLKQFKKTAEKDGSFSQVENQYNALVSGLSKQNDQLIEKDSTRILDLLSNEIVGRYYFQKGQTINKLTQDDPTLKKAISILYDQKAYQKVLK